MARHFKLILLISLPLACITSEERIIIKKFPDGKIEKEKVITDTKNNLTYFEITYYTNGNKKSEIEFYDKRFNGRLLEFYENGNKKLEGVTQMGQFIGIKYNYDSHGKLHQTDSLLGLCPAAECCCDAVITRFYSNGKVKEKFTTKSGLINGQLISYYENGIVESTRNFVDEKEEGKSFFWTEDGKLKFEITYRGGIRNGFRKEYDDYYTSEGFYENGKEVGNGNSLIHQAK